MIRRIRRDPAGSRLIGRSWQIPVILLGPLLIDGLALSGAGCFANGPTICPSYFGQEKLALLATLHFIAAFLITPVVAAGQPAPISGGDVAFLRLLRAAGLCLLANLAWLLLFAAVLLPGAITADRLIAIAAVLTAFTLTIAIVTHLFVKVSRRPWAAVALALSSGVLFVVATTTLMAFLPDPAGASRLVDAGALIGSINPAAALMSAAGYQTHLLGLPVPAPLGDFFSARKNLETLPPLWQTHLVIVMLFVALPIAGRVWLQRGRSRR